MNGPAMVLAGPGSGKTLVITKRTKNLISKENIKPINILVITFTKAAAIQMKDRFDKLNDGKIFPVNFGTFHSIFYKIIKYAYNYDGSNILREEEKYLYIKEVIENIKYDVDDANEFISDILNEISVFKSEMHEIKDYVAKSCVNSLFRRIYTSYQNKLRKNNKVDFDDMILICYRLLKERPDILKLWQEKYKYILVDEFQDINKLQYEVIKMLSQKSKNIFIVGDDDQSIYRFRGANPEIMLSFEKDFIGTKRYILNQNYRSTGEIVSFSKKIINKNKNRFKKNIISEKIKGEKPIKEIYRNVFEENEGIVNHIKNYKSKGFKYSDMAILVRTNTLAENLIETLVKNNISFRMKDNIPVIYEHWIAKDIFSYISISSNSILRSDFLKIMNRPKRYISRDVLYDKEVDFEMLRCAYEEKEYMQDIIDRMEYDIKFLKNMNPFAAINYIRKGIGYEDFLLDYAKEKNVNFKDLTSILDEIQERSKEHKTIKDWFNHIEEYKKNVSQKKSQEKTQDSVEISTMHSSKGLEYRVVFIPDINEGIIPHSKANFENEIEEERRLFYVAVTRAKEKIHLSSVKERYGKTIKQSAFLNEI